MADEAIVELRALVGATDPADRERSTPRGAPLIFACTTRSSGSRRSRSLTSDRDRFQAFLHDPLAAARLDLDQAWKLFDEMIEANARSLPQFARY